MAELFYCTEQTALGKLFLVAENDILRAVCFEEIPSKFACAIARKTPLLQQASQQIEEYLQGKRKNFSDKTHDRY